MGLISAAASSVSSVFADQWKEYFYCDAIPNDILAVKAKKRTSGRSSNRGNDNVISNGSVIAVADGQCMAIVDNGRVADFCAVPGEYIYDISSEPSLLDGGRLAKNIKEVFKAIGKRFTFGGEIPKEQRVYYFNTKEIMGNKYGTPSPVPFRVVDRNVGFDIDIAIKCFGEYSFRITNPLLFYTNVCGNVSQAYDLSEIQGQLKSELLTALQPAFAKIGETGIRYSSLPAHTLEMADALNDVLSSKWGEKRGIEIVEFGVSSVKADPEDEKMMKELQRNATFRNAQMASAQMVGATSQAMVDAANNANGAAMGFMGMNFAQGMGGSVMNAMYQNQPQQPVQAAPAAGSWTCSCGTVNTGKFCQECGLPKPAPAEWTCKCGAVNKGKFCSECGAPKPASDEWTCSCGTVVKGKFCPECGSRRP